MANGKATDHAQIVRQENTIKVLELRRAFKSFRAIATELNISVSTAHDYYKTAMGDLKEVETAEAGEVRRAESENLDIAAAAIFDKVKAGDLNAIDRWLKISAQRAALWGANAATSQNLNLLMGMGAVEIEPEADYRTAIATLSPGGNGEHE